MSKRALDEESALDSVVARVDEEDLVHKDHTYSGNVIQIDFINCSAYCWKIFLWIIMLHIITCKYLHQLFLLLPSFNPEQFSMILKSKFWHSTSSILSLLNSCKSQKWPSKHKDQVITVGKGSSSGSFLASCNCFHKRMKISFHHLFWIIINHSESSSLTLNHFSSFCIIIMFLCLTRLFKAGVYWFCLRR